MEPAKGPLTGRTVAGKFVIEAHLGGGAMGEVYRARHALLDTQVALKVMRQDLAEDKRFAERFYREAKAASLLEHPNSVRVLDFGEEPDGLLYIAMEFLGGRDLLRLIEEEHPLPEGRVVSLLLQMLSALSAAHGLGIVHRDVKPENIMVVPPADREHDEDIVKVCDFGVAKIADPRSYDDADATRPLTATGTLIGTPEYMSPEQAKGDPLDARSDLYSLGVVMFQMLTARVPFTAETAMGVALKQISDAPPAPSTYRRGLTPELEAICLRALEKRPDDRYQTAKEMRFDLRSLVARGIAISELGALSSDAPAVGPPSSSPRLAPTSTPPGLASSLANSTVPLPSLQGAGVDEVTLPLHVARFNARDALDPGPGVGKSPKALAVFAAAAVAVGIGSAVLLSSTRPAPNTAAPPVTEARPPTVQPSVSVTSHAVSDDAVPVTALAKVPSSRPKASSTSPVASPSSSSKLEDDPHGPPPPIPSSTGSAPATTVVEAGAALDAGSNGGAAAPTPAPAVTSSSSRPE